MDNNMQNHNPKFKILAISFLMLLGFFGLAKTSLAATPAISNVSGTVATGQTLTISGSNMVDEDKTNWDTFFTTHPTAYGFEGIGPGTAGQCDGDCYCDLGPCEGTYDTNMKLSGNQSIKFHAQGVSSDCPDDNLFGGYHAVNLDGGSAADKWLRWYARWNAANNSWVDSGVKMLTSANSETGYPEMWYFNPAGTGDHTMPYTMSTKYYISNEYANIPSGQLQNNRWYLFEAHWKNKDTMIYEIWMDNIKIFDGVPDGLASLDYIMFGLINLCGTLSDFSLDHWWDGFTVSSSRIYPSSTIEIANSSNYSTATKVYQEPLYLSDGSVQIKSDLAGLGSGPYYLFITNNRQETSAAYALSGGEDTTPPSAPSGLMVS